MLLSDKVPLQGNVKNYLGKQKTVEAPLHWKSAPDHPKTKLAYITDEEEKILVDLNLYDSMDGKPNTGPHGIPSLNGGGGGSEGAGSDSGGGGGGNDSPSPGDTGGAGGDPSDPGSEASNSGNDGGYGGFDGTEGTFSTDTSNTGASGGGGENVGDDNTAGFGAADYGDWTNSSYDYESAAYGPGKITSASLTPSSFFGYGTVTINQTPGVISAKDYTAASLQSVLDDPNTKESDKVGLLNNLQASLNSSLVGTKLSNIDEQAALFALDNLSHSLAEVKGNPAYDNLTSQIDETKSTFGAQLQDDPLGTVFTNGGVLSTVAKSLYDSYKNNTALSVIGFNGQPMNKQGYNPNDPSYDPYYGTDQTTDNGGGDGRSTLGQLVLQTGGFKPWTGPSAAIGFFAKNPYNVQTLYNNAKEKITGILQAPPSPYGVNAISDSPFYDYLKTFNLDKGIL